MINKCPTTQFCDFEDGLCEYDNDISPQVNFNWERVKGQISKTSGPENDHTYRTPEGYYMMINSALARNPNDKARLISETIKPTPDGVCLSFWYYSCGKNVGSLRIYTRTGQEISTSSVWSVFGDWANQWKIATVSINILREFEV